MIGNGEGALICDFAETYHIFDYKALPIKLCSTLAVGLPRTARIWAKLGEPNLRLIKEQALILLLDRVSWIQWAMSDNASQGGEPPKPIYNKVFGLKEDEATSRNVLVFDSPDDFQAERERIRREILCQH